MSAIIGRPPSPADPLEPTRDATPADALPDTDERQTAIIAVVKPGLQGTSAPAVADGPAEETTPPTRGPRLVAPRVVALRPDRTDDGYVSVHSRLTRTGVRSVAGTVGKAFTEVLITFGLIAVLFAAYEIWGTTRIVDAHQQDLDQQLSQQWATDPGTVAPADTPGSPVASASAGPPAKPLTPPPGNALARMYIPRLNKYWVVVEGVEPNDLKFGPGHYPKTAKPGQVGNFAVAGHRIPAMFWDLDVMRTGDAVVVETASTWYVYKVSQVHIVSPTAVEVVAPVPGQPTASATTAMLTITTCNPKWDNTQRLVVHAKLSRQQSRTSGRPTELGQL